MVKLHDVLELLREIEEPKAGNIPPLWDGRASFRCHAVLRTHLLGEQNATGYLYA